MPDNRWYRADVDLHAVNQIEFSVVHGGSSVQEDLSDIALDSIMVTDGRCGGRNGSFVYMIVHCNL